MNPEHLHTDIVIPGCPLALESQARLGRVDLVRTNQFQHDRDAFDLEKVWRKRGVSHQFLEQVVIWARAVNERLHATANGKMISELAKRPECEDAMFACPFTPPSGDAPVARRG